MAIRVGWANAEQSIVYLQFVGRWTIDEFSEALLNYRTLAAETSVDLLINVVDTDHLPSGALVRMRKEFQRGIRRSRRVVVLGCDNLKAILVKDALALAYPHLLRRAVFMDSLAEAMVYLNAPVEVA